jgi:hypothetical protein
MMPFPYSYLDPGADTPAALFARLKPMLDAWPVGTAEPKVPPPTGDDPPPQPASAPRAQAIGGLGGIGDWLGNNRAALMALGAGIAGGRNWGEGIGKGLQLAVSAMQSDRQRRALATQQAATVQALRARGIPDAEVIAAMNPYMARLLLSRAPGVR